MQQVVETWAVLREFFIGLEIPDELIQEADAIVCMDVTITFEAPNESEAALADVWRRLTAAALEREKQLGAELPSTAVDALKRMEAVTAAYNRARLAEADASLSTPRGEEYLRFAKWAHSRLANDDLYQSLVLALPRAPKPDPAVLKAQQAPLTETRVRAVADSILGVVETYYRPLLEVLWHLTWLATGDGTVEKPPNMTGSLMSKLRKRWDTSGSRRVDDFIYFPANDVRKGAGHPGLMSYDPNTKELVLRLDNGIFRIDEDELRLRFNEVFVRCRTMYFALLRAGEVERVALTAG